MACMIRVCLVAIKVRLMSRYSWSIPRWLVEQSCERRPPVRHERCFGIERCEVSRSDGLAVSAPFQGGVKNVTGCLHDVPLS